MGGSEIRLRIGNIIVFLLLRESPCRLCVDSPNFGLLKNRNNFIAILARFLHHSVNSFSRVVIDALVKAGVWISLRAGPISLEVAQQFLSIRNPNQRSRDLSPKQIRFEASFSIPVRWENK
jgi:hypothetical protein